MKLLRVVLLLASMALLLAGCSAFVDQDQVRVVSEASVLLETGHQVGQTFVARHAGLNGVDVWLEPIAGDGELRCDLLVDPHVEQAAATATLPLAQVTSPGFYHFSFPSRPNSHGRYCYAFLELVGDGQIRVGAGPGNAYLEGAAYRDHQPLDVQMAFRLAYDPVWILLDLGQAAISWMGLGGMAVLLYVVPGWALLAWFWPENPFSWAGRLGIAAGLSLAVYPVVILWTSLVGLRLGLLYAWLPVVIGLAAIIWRYQDWRPRQGWEALRRWTRSDALWPDLALLAVLGLVFGVRFLVVRTLDAPLWGDSYQHTMIVQLLVDHGGLFDSWEPYAPLQTFTYHFGFHSMVAAFHWLTGLSAMPAMIWGGQLLNGLAVLALYPLAARVSGSRWAGVGAVLVAGLLLSMPMVYTNWGRYTQLAGQVILPAAVIVTWLALEAPHRKWRLGFLNWIVVGGLALSHYRVLIFYLAFVVTWVLLSWRRLALPRIASRVVWVGIGAIVLFLPWLVHTFVGEIARNFGLQLSTQPGQLSSFAFEYNTIGDMFSYLTPLWWLILLVSVGVGLWRQRHGALLVSLWWFVLLIAANPAWLQLPGTGAISNFALFIAVYIPAGVLVGDLFGQLATRLTTRWRAGLLVALLLVGISLAGVRDRLDDLRVDSHALLVRPDLRAMAWIQDNTPGDAVFLVNSFFAYGGTVIAGSDGGWWLPLVAGRDNTSPPLTYGLEQGPDPGYRSRINDLTRQIQDAGLNDPGTLAMLRERGITHVYIGQRQGQVGRIGPHTLDPRSLLQSTHYRPVYHQDRVWVFEVAR